MTDRSAEVMASPDKYQGKTVPGALGAGPCTPCLQNADTGRRMGPPICVELAGRLTALLADVFWGFHMCEPADIIPPIDREAIWMVSY